MQESVESSAIIDAMIADNEKGNLPKLDSSVLFLKDSRNSPSHDSRSQGIPQEENLVENAVLKVDSNIDQQTLDLSYGLPIIQPKEAINNCLACGQIGCQCAQQNINSGKDTNTSNRSPQIKEHFLNGDRHDHDHEDGLEADFPIYNAAANADLAASSSSSASLASSQTFLLHSNPSAKHTIYLDFTGHTTSGTWWNDGGTIQSSAYDRDGNKSSFSASELSEIQSIWQQVSEDFAPFNVNITTQDPGVDALRKTSSSDSRWGVRVLFTDNRNDIDGSAVAAGAGGVAYIGSFNRNVDQPVFVFNKGAKAAAVTASHEVGHSLSLGHDGISGQTSYHPGHGSGATSWGTIMGAPFQENLTQWSRGDYSGADNKEDDLSIITTKNGFGYRTDDYGNNQSTASELILNSAGDVSAYGVIERNTDVDYFSFNTGSGAVSFNINPASKALVAGGGGYSTAFLNAQGANLDIWAGLYNSSGTLLAASNPSGTLSASFNLTLAAGTYYLRVDGVGLGNPFSSASGYTDYGSLGQYSISGTIKAPPKALVLYGTASSDTLIAQAGSDLLLGQANNDTLYGGAGADTLYGGSGNDYLVGGSGRDALIGDAGNDVLFGQDDHDKQYGGIGNDTLYGGNGDDYLVGGSGRDALIGDAGNDVLFGQDDNDTLYGRIGDDTLYGGNGDDYLVGESGRDALVGDAGNDVLFGLDDNDTLSGKSGSDTIYGGNGADALYGGDQQDYLVGAAGTDVLVGDAGNDLLFGQNDNDTLYGRIGDDTLYGGNGDDYLVGESGRDVLIGDAGNDLQFGQNDNDTLYGRTGDDTLYGGNGNDYLVGEDGIDILIGDAGNDLQFGQNGNDVLYGRTGDDTLYGGNGNDYLSGGDGRDVIKGDSGNDRLVGNAGNDILVGGSGADRFILTGPDQGTDVIVDFERGTDLIQISGSAFGGGLMVGMQLSSTQFHLGSTATTNAHRLTYEQSSGRLFFDQDGIGSSLAMHIATFSSKPMLSSQDFMISS